MIFATEQITSELFNPHKHNIAVEQFKALSPSERDDFFARHGAKQDLKEAFEAIVSCSNYSTSNNILHIALNGTNAKTIAVFFKAFVCSTHAMTHNMKFVDMRNEMTAKTCKEIAAFDFDSAEIIKSASRSVCTEYVHWDAVEKMSKSFETMNLLMDEYKITVEEVGSILASAWYYNHPTIQQSFLRDVLTTAETLLHEHQKNQNNTFADDGLVKVLSGLVSLADNNHLPFI